MIIIEDDRKYWGAVTLVVIYSSFDIEQVDGDWYKIDDKNNTKNTRLFIFLCS